MVSKKDMLRIVLKSEYAIKFRLGFPYIENIKSGKANFGRLKKGFKSVAEASKYIDELIDFRIRTDRSFK